LPDPLSPISLGDFGLVDFCPSGCPLGAEVCGAFTLFDSFVALIFYPAYELLDAGWGERCFFPLFFFIEIPIRFI
jgi:hypothetical protein